MTPSGTFLDRQDESRLVVPVGPVPGGIRCRIYWRRWHGWDAEPIAETLAHGFGGFAVLPASLFDKPYGFARVG
jgi:hypothetical protein